MSAWSDEDTGGFSRSKLKRETPTDLLEDGENRPKPSKTIQIPLGQVDVDANLSRIHVGPRGRRIEGSERG